MTGHGMYPLNKSLAEEVQRLFHTWCSSFSSTDSNAEDDIMADFRSNGHHDSEYLPETAANLATSDIIKVRKKPKKLITECVFCKKNGEARQFYTSHNLKTAEGKILCPVLRAYTCPICQANGDDAHTIRYCPERQEPLEMMITLCCDKSD